MKTIWKFELAPSGTIKMPKGAEVLSVREQGDGVCIWALVDPEAPVELRRFAFYGTGHPLPDRPLKFLGAAHPYGGNLVFHVFEDPLPPEHFKH